MSRPEVVVVGAGIGGLAAAVGFRRIGWQVVVCERAGTLRSTGGGIGLTPNGLRALDAIDAGRTVRSRAVEQRDGGIRRPGGDWIARTDLDFIRDRFGDPVIALHRADLTSALAGLLPAGAVQTGTHVTTVVPGAPGRRARVTTTRGELTADLVVGADGIRSAVRTALFPRHPGIRYAGYTSWRVVVPAPAQPVTAGETWGRGARFAILPLPDGRVHCSALASAPAHRPRGNEAVELIRHFGEWHDPIPELLRSVTVSSLFHDDIEELAAPLPSFSRGSVALVGDAAHAMTPNLGSANLALEDAVSLVSLIAANHAADGGDIPSVLSQYTACRRKRVVRLARRSRRIGRIGQWSSPVAVAARNIGFWLGGLLPAPVTARALDSVLGWTAPVIPAPAPAIAEPPLGGD
jgi:2-polyprenyl-6-methoxyphenol hydroxylase-like FAD-dependent oxidoreductase